MNVQIAHFELTSFDKQDYSSYQSRFATVHQWRPNVTIVIYGYNTLKYPESTKKSR